MAIIGITMGDCAGIGPEIILKSLCDDELKKGNRFFIYGERKAFEDMNRRLGNIADIDEMDFVDMDIIKLPIEYGAVKSAYGLAAGRYIEKAIKDAMDKRIEAIVTAPIHKKSFELGGYGKKFAGHTEMLADMTGTKDYTMMLAYKNLRVIHVSIHVSLKQAIESVTTANVYNAIKLGYQTCRRLGLEDIRMAVAGLNPHAGDSGLFGNEEALEIIPAIEKARKELNCSIEGPVPADTVFSKAYGGMYDMVVAMYHDQGHIPLKTLGFIYNHDTAGWKEVQGVNVTLGLPIIRTSVDHGTAFGKAGKGSASAESMKDAIRYALKLAASDRGQKK
jgi:4-hydroxythreonine-4-phosphate dehydrogenase